VALKEPKRFRFDRYMLPPTARLKVESQAHEVRLALRVEGRMQKIIFKRSEGSWTSSVPLDCLPVVHRKDRRWLLWARDLLETKELDDLAENMDGSEPDLMRSRCEAALDVISEFSPEYHRWVGGVIRGIVPWRVQKDQYPSGSGSSGLAPGLIGMGNHDHPYSLADTLIHEASHHYFYIASRLGAVDDGTDSTLYLNPILNLRRPIRMILLSFHAFANVLIFTRAALRKGSESMGYLENRERQLEVQLRGLTDALHSTGALTVLGRNLWEPLYDRIRIPARVEI
jgi:HEXXH motif-containing protein